MKGMLDTVLHIGMHKTASTFLQQWYFPQLEVNSCMQPKDAGEYISRSPNFDPEQFYNIIESEKVPCPESNILLISHEDFSGSVSGSKTQKKYLISERLATAFSNAKVIVVVRRQRDWLKSLYGFRVSLSKKHEVRSFEDFLIKRKITENAFDKLQYDKLVGLYVKHFGRSNLLVLPYESIRKDWAGFQRAVCSFIGVSKVIMFKGTGPIVLASPKNVKIINQMRRWNSGFQKLRRSTKLLGRSGPKTGAALDAAYSTVKKWLIPILEKYHGRNSEPLQIPTDIEERLQKIIPESNCRLNRMVDIDLAMYEYDLD
jgi:hypothetical protein